MGGHTEEQLIVNGKRPDGRSLDELRPIEAKIGVLKRADGSAMFKFGKSWAIAGVYGPRKVLPRHEEQAERAILRTEYRMASFSTAERSRPGPSRRSQEISMVMRNAILPAIFLDEFPRTAIDAVIEILEADASTRCAAINAAVLALADAGVPMRDLVSSCSAGVVNGQIVLDIAGKEDTAGELDLPVAYYHRKKELTLLQMDGIASPETVKQIIRTAIRGCEQVYEVQKRALRARYEIEVADQ
ncbi:MAG: exosome complex exonuclease Rrp41 [Candidatus Aenigmatarchaeota archaeon]